MIDLNVVIEDLLYILEGLDTDSPEVVCGKVKSYLNQLKKIKKN